MLRIPTPFIQFAPQLLDLDILGCGVHITVIQLGTGHLPQHLGSAGFHALASFFLPDSLDAR